MIPLLVQLTGKVANIGRPRKSTRNHSYSYLYKFSRNVGAIQLPRKPSKQQFKYGTNLRHHNGIIWWRLDYPHTSDQFLEKDEETRGALWSVGARKYLANWLWNEDLRSHHTNLQPSSHRGQIFSTEFCDSQADSNLRALQAGLHHTVFILMFLFYNFTNCNILHYYYSSYPPWTLRLRIFHRIKTRSVLSAPIYCISLL